MTRKKDKSKTPASGTRRIERRDYGTVLVRTPRPGVKIEQLMTGKSEKRKTNR